MTLVDKDQRLFCGINPKPKVSIVLINYNMSRELPKTLFTLEPPYQQHINSEDIEIIIVDNGSSRPINIPAGYSNINLVHCAHPTHSPSRAINLGVAAASSDFIGLMIDGARMASPQLLHFAIMAKNLAKRPVVSTLAYHLGSEVQMKSTLKGYNQEIEDKLLNSVPWQQNGYELFNISVLAGSSRSGWFKPIAESNALFLTKEMWQELDGVDEQFQTPGGGLVNLDLYIRANELQASTLFSLLGEGTFHQVHGGVATNQHREEASWAVFHDEYKTIRNKPFKIINIEAVHLGKIRSEHRDTIASSIEHLT